MGIYEVLGEDDVAIAVALEREGLPVGRLTNGRPLHGDRAHAHAPEGAILMLLWMLWSPKRNRPFISTLVCSRLHDHAPIKVMRLACLKLQHLERRIAVTL